MLGYEFLQASPKEQMMILLVLLGALAIVGILCYFNNRNKKT